MAVITRLIKRHEGQRILIAGHGETIDAAASLLLQLPPGSCTRNGFQTDHAAITSWHMQRNRLGQQLWMLATHNDTQHLASTP
jgi:probable phosphoglycerate mutase